MFFLLALIALALTGCGDITRAEYERANADRYTKLAEFPLDNGDTRVCYGGTNPQISFDGKTYTNPSGMRVVTYRGTTDGGKIVARWWQDDEPLLP
jgi:hypothetical protein